MSDDFPTLFAYTRWADGSALDACRRLSPEQYVAEPAPGWSSVRSSMVHIASATGNWVRRLAGETVTRALTEADLPALDDAERRLNETYRMLDGLWPTWTPQWLAAPQTFELRAMRLVLPPWVVLRHVVNHATYHRGQVASKLKRFGVEPPMTDFVFWARDQLSPQG